MGHSSAFSTLSCHEMAFSNFLSQKFSGWVCPQALSSARTRNWSLPPQKIFLAAPLLLLVASGLYLWNILNELTSVVCNTEPLVCSIYFQLTRVRITWRFHYKIRRLWQVQGRCNKPTCTTWFNVCGQPSFRTTFRPLNKSSRYQHQLCMYLPIKTIITGRDSKNFTVPEDCPNLSWKLEFIGIT